MYYTESFTTAQVDEIRRLSEEEGMGQLRIAKQFNTSRWKIRQILDGSEEYTIPDADAEILKGNVELAEKLQKTQDTNRLKNKQFREHARIKNAVAALDEKLAEVFTSEKLHKPKTQKHEKMSGHGFEVLEDTPVGIVHLSDIHFGEQIDMGPYQFNTEIASKRIQKHIAHAKRHFKALGVHHVCVCFTGDLVNSDRRVCEALTNADNRSKTIFVAVDILQQAILDLNSDFNVSVFSITGNESRVNKDLGWVTQVASDSYDLVIHNILLKLFDGCEGVDVVPINDPLEQVISVNGKHILLIHGHNGLARTQKIEEMVTKTMGRYAAMGVHVDYVICGHIHSAYISDNFARSSGLPGSNAYSEKALNLRGRASQNLYLVYPDAINGIKIDLEETDGYTGYEYNIDLEHYNVDTEQEGNLIIQRVLV